MDPTQIPKNTPETTSQTNELHESSRIEQCSENISCYPILATLKKLLGPHPKPQKYPESVQKSPRNQEGKNKKSFKVKVISLYAQTPKIYLDHMPTSNLAHRAQKGCIVLAISIDKSLQRTFSVSSIANLQNCIWKLFYALSL